MVDQARAELATLETVPTIDEVRAILSAVPGSFSQDVIAERGDYWLAQFFLDTGAVVGYYHIEAGSPKVWTISFAGHWTWRRPEIVGPVGKLVPAV